MIPSRQVLTLLAVVVLSLGLGDWGFYSLSAFGLTLIALASAVLACVTQDRPAGLRSRQRVLHVLTALAAGTTSITAIFLTGIWYAGREFSAWSMPAKFALPSLAVLGLAPVLYLLLFGHRMDQCAAGRQTRWWLTLSMALAAGIALRACVLIAAPEPIVDVFTLLRDSTDHVIAGKNPYAEPIETPYGTPWARDHGAFEEPNARPAGYPPLPLLLCVPVRLLGLDVRWANIAADGVAALAIAVLGLRRGRPAIGLLAATMYLNLPRTPFIIEQAWYEPMIAALLGVGLVLTEFRGFAKWLGYMLLGLGLTAKQFGLPLLFPLAAAHRRNWKLIALGLLVGGLIMLPWLLWSPRDFLDIVLFKHLGRPPQPHSITVASFLLNEFDVVVPRIVGWLLAAGAILVISIVTPRECAATALGLGTALLAFCVCHTQGFPNYFYLVQYLWLIGFVGLLPRIDEEYSTHAIARPAA